MTEVVKQKASQGAGVELTEAARNHFLKILANEVAQGMRLSIKKTGCSGYSYVVEPVSKSIEGDLAWPIDNQFYIYVDKSSYPFLKGVVIDYKREGLNTKLVFNNPNQTGQCGCGESFTIENL